MLNCRKYLVNLIYVEVSVSVMARPVVSMCYYLDSSDCQKG